MNKQKRYRKKTKKRHILRRAFLTAEVFVIGFFCAGGTDMMQSARADDKYYVSYEKRTAQAPSVTPVFRWKNYPVIAHALGGLDGKTYLNSKESFIENYKKGYRLFEVDLTQTSDGVWVCRHSWNSPMGQWEGEEKKVLSSEEFLSKPIYGSYTPMTFSDLLVLLKDYPDAFVLLDSKQYSIRNYQKTLEDYSEYLEIAVRADAEEVIDQLIPEIYNEAMYPGTAFVQKFPTYLYSLWQEYSLEELETIADFCKEKNIPAATMYMKYWTKEAQIIFDERGILLYIYTVNDPKDAAVYMKQGAAGICTDILTEEQMLLEP